MKLLPHFREERILREEVKLVYQNYVTGLICVFLLTILAAVILFIVTEPKGVFYWLAASAVVSFVPLIRYLHLDIENINPEKEATKQVWEILLIGIVWGIFPLFYTDGNSIIVMITITAFSTGLAAAALAMLSPCLPVFFALAYTSLPALILSLFLLGGPAYFAIGTAATLFLITLTVFSYNLELTVKNSIELRFENLELIDQLQDAITETEDANRAKSVFLASASHDLRQPLHAMGLFIETLNSTKLDAYQQSVISHIESASEATREMLNTLLDFSKLDAGVIEPRPRPFRLQTLFNKLEQELAASADSKNIIYRTRETTAAAYADMSLVELILRNLITNAIRYTESGGVLIGYRHKENDMFVVEVWDTGIGIAKEEQKNIFREFHQLGNPERDRQKGFGLGLAIAKGLAATMKLELSVSSKPESGSVFRLTLPQAEISVVEDIPTEQAASRFDGKQILIIDDDESVRVAMRELLMSWGCDCLIAGSADEGLNIINGKQLDLLIVDYRLREEKTGREAITLLREKHRASLPAIIITGDTAADRLREAQASDALLLHKPVSTNELQRTMTSLLNL
jgi:two-component system, sensor histidine kinase